LRYGEYFGANCENIFFLHKVNITQAAVCVVASQIANFGESYIGAVLQDKEGFQWVSILSQMILVTLQLLFDDSCQ
jgi:hypothetical protein